MGSATQCTFTPEALVFSKTLFFTAFLFCFLHHSQVVISI